MVGFFRGGKFSQILRLDSSFVKIFLPTNKTVESILPNPQGPLSRVVPSSRIEAINKVVKPIVEEAIIAEAKGNSLGSRGKYRKRQKFSLLNFYSAES